MRGHWNDPMSSVFILIYMIDKSFVIIAGAQEFI